MQLVKRDIAPVSGPDPLHRGLVFGAPCIRERQRIDLWQDRGDLACNRGTPVDAGAENVEDQGLGAMHSFITLS